jgi:phosphatidate cytidylyltransferase
MSTFLRRTLVVLVLLPVGLGLIYLGSWYFLAMVALILLLAAYEYVGLFRVGGFEPSIWVAVGGTLLVVIGRQLNGFDSSGWILSLAVLGSMAYHLFTYERGRDQAGTDFAITVSAVLYIGWLGAYLVSIRNLEQGFWWLLLVLVPVWLADAGAYILGSMFGQHKITPRLSPGKTWEGYLGGIVAAVLGAVLLVLLHQALTAGDSEITVLSGALLGLVLGATSIFGDVGESMIKRQVGRKDSGNLLPGHGGAFDRIDSWLWAAAIGYYLIAGIIL